MGEREYIFPLNLLLPAINKIHLMMTQNIIRRQLGEK